MNRVGFIGLGAMGLPMALNLVRAGHEVYYRGSKKESARIMKEAGGLEAEDLHAVAAKAEYLITIIPSDKELQELFMGEDSLLIDLPEGACVIDMTSSSVGMMRELDRRIKAVRPDLFLIDAPVSGGVIGARKGTLTIMAGCEDTSVLEAAGDVLGAMGTKIIHTGGIGSGSGVKIINNMLMAAHVEVASEALCMARLLGLDPSLTFHVINQSGGRSWMTERMVPNFLIPGDHDHPSFRLELMEKDIGLYVTEAHSAGAFSPVMELTAQIYRASGTQEGNDKRNFTVIGEWMEKNQPFHS